MANGKRRRDSDREEVKAGAPRYYDESGRESKAPFDTESKDVPPKARGLRYGVVPEKFGGPQATMRYLHRKD